MTDTDRINICTACSAPWVPDEKDYCSVCKGRGPFGPVLTYNVMASRRYDFSLNAVAKLDAFLTRYGLKYWILVHIESISTVEINVRHFWLRRRKLLRELKERMSVGTKVIVTRGPFFHCHWIALCNYFDRLRGHKKDPIRISL